MHTGPVHDNLVEILEHPASSNLILVGGMSILLRMDWLRRQQVRTLIEEIPAARATRDLDFILGLDLFVDRQKGTVVRKMLNELGYKSKTDFMQFIKGGVLIDLMARQPDVNDENSALKVNDSRVGSRDTISLHGRNTAEAFAVEDHPYVVQVQLDRKSGLVDRFSVRIAHPYSLINMKVRATRDWHESKSNPSSPKPFGEKHALDVFILVASLTEPELLDCERLASKYKDHKVAREIRSEAEALFSTLQSPGFAEVRRQAGRIIDHGSFFDGLRQSIGSA